VFKGLNITYIYFLVQLTDNFSRKTLHHATFVRKIHNKTYVTFVVVMTLLRVFQPCP